MFSFSEYCTFKYLDVKPDAMAQQWGIFYLRSWLIGTSSISRTGQAANEVSSKALVLEAKTVRCTVYGQKHSVKIEWSDQINNQIDYVL